MDTLFVLLLLVSVVALTVGLIQPKVFSKLFKARANRKTMGLVFGSAIILFFILFGVTAPPVTKTTKPSTTKTTPTPVKTLSPEEQAKKAEADALAKKKADEEKAKAEAEETKTAEPKPTEKPEDKEMRILQEQKDKAENLTKTAVKLITEDKMSEAKTLYEARWNELANLRVEIMYDDDLSDKQKENIDKPLKGEQEGIANILSEYEQLYR